MKIPPKAPDRVRRRLLTTAAALSATALWSTLGNAQQPRPAQPARPPAPRRPETPPPASATSLPNGYPWIDTQAAFAYIDDAVNP